MKKLTIPISGISRNTDDAISTDGQCIELINARPKNGSIEPVGRPILEQAFTGGKTPIFIHKNSSYEHVISYFNNNVIFDCVRENEGYTVKNLSICFLPGLKQVESVGNILVMTTNECTYYALFVKQSYKYLGAKPPFPIINFTLSSDGSLTEASQCNLPEPIGISFVGGNLSLGYNMFSDSNANVVTNALNGSASKLISNAKEKGYFTYPLFLRYALKMYDGSYICHSAPILLLTARTHSVFTVINKDSDIIFKDGKFTAFKYRTIVDKSKLKYLAFTTDLSDWSDIITSIDVFVSRPITTANLDDLISGFNVETGPLINIDLNYKSEENFKESVISSSIFYKLHSFDIQDSYAGGEIFKEGIYDNIEQKETISDDNFTHNTISGGSYVYNARLHLYSIKEMLYSGYPLSIFDNYYPSLWGEGSDKLPELNAIATCQVFINTDNGEKNVSYSCSIRNRGIIPFLCYPDSRATKMIIRLTSGGRKYQKTFLLKKHSFLNLAYSLNQLTALKLSDFNETVTAEVENDPTVYSPNKIKVSEVNNPFNFPAKLTYAVSNRNIIGMASTTTALSTGQFGQFPLYVFTEEGIFAMSTGSDGIAYSNSYPVSRDCCNNPSSIISTDNAVVFSSNRGLMIISGSTVGKLSDNIEGFLPSSIDSSPIINKVAGVAGVQGSLSSTEFVYFLENAVIGYNYEDKEIIVSNPSYKYSYVYGLESGMWHKISVSINSFINSYPECFAIFTDHGMYNMHNRHRTVNKILLLTRPVKFGSVTHKRILQSAIRGVIRPSQSNLYLRGESVKYRDQEISIFSNCGFYILGSNDAEHFTLISGREKIEDIRDLITKMNKTHAYKYFMFCIAGGVRTDVSLNYIEVLVDETFQNRLR